ncbi:MAG: hypothetical protein IT287_04860 [Bdellovibrionaceae bacterium]|nr:hypothetical protein [Pseudobdellovibrionaceae bacterium]
MHKVYFVAGKGGVGKSTMAAFFARREASKGKKTLLVEMGPWSYYQKWWPNMPAPTYSPQRTPYGFDWAMWTGEDCLKEYVGHLVKVPFVSRAFLDNTWMRALVKIAPGLREISFLGKATSQIREHGPAMKYDSIVIDAVISGHFISLLQAPVGLQGMAKMGPIHEQCKHIIAALNSASVETLLVSTLENFAVQETQELMSALQKLLKSKISVLANKDIPIPAHAESASGRYENPQKEMLQTLAQIDRRQNENKKWLSEKYPHVYKVPFYYQPLLEILNDEREIQQIYSEL